MVLRRRRPLLRAAVVGGVAYHAGQKRAVRQEGAGAEQLAQPSPSAAGPSPQPGGEDTVTQLTKLKELLDAGALTQEEFEAEKRKVLARG